MDALSKPFHAKKQNHSPSSFANNRLYRAYAYVAKIHPRFPKRKQITIHPNRHISQSIRPYPRVAKRARAKCWISLKQGSEIF